MMYIDILPANLKEIKSSHLKFIDERKKSVKKGKTKNRELSLKDILNNFEKKYKNKYLKFPSDLANEFFRDLNDIILGDFSCLETLKLKYQCLHIDKSILSKKKHNKYEKFLIRMGDEIRDFLGYDSFSTDSEDWCSRKFIDLLKISVCPYCNAQYIYVSSNNEGIKPQIDHFFPKAENPIFSCSIYNMIPSCYNCNHLKADKEWYLLNPYVSGFGDKAMFSIAVKNKEQEDVDKIILNKHYLGNIKVLLKPDPISIEKIKINNARLTFKLDESYNCFQMELIDLIKRLQISNKAKGKNLSKTLGLVSEKEIKSLIMGIPLGSEKKNYLFKKIKEDFWKKFHK